MGGMRFSLAALLWLTICCFPLFHLYILPPYFLRDYRFVNLRTAEVFSVWPVEAAGRIALMAAVYYLGLRVIRNRFYRQP
jgi:hypothetical protein